MRHPVLPCRAVKRRSPLLLAAWLVLPACARSPREAGPSEPSAPPGRGDASEDGPDALRYVMLWDHATLASSPSSDAETARAEDPRPADPEDLAFWIMRMRATDGDWLELETVDTSTDDFFHCVPSLSALDDYRLRVFARRQDAAPVLRREVTVSLPGGNRVTLSPGVRITPPARDGELAAVHVFPPLVLPLPAQALGHDYPPPRRYDDGDAVATLHADSVRLTDAVELPPALHGQVFARRDEGDAAIVTLAHGCARYEVRVPASAVAPVEPFGLGGLGMTPRTGARHRIAADVPVYWSSGERAGVTRRPILRYDEPSRREVGRVCFDHALSEATPTTEALTLCFDVSDVGPAKPSRASPPALADAAG